MAGRLVKSIGALIGLGVIGAGVFLVVTRPQPLPDEYWATAGTPDVKNGELVFSMGGCVSCHKKPGAEGADALVLAGGVTIDSPYGKFHVPNISPDEKAGIGNWTLAQFGNAVTRGVGPDGSHLYPSLPYGSYSRMTPKDVGDLFAYIKTLPKSDNVAPPHELGFPYNMRLALGGWKWLYFSDAPRVELANADATVKRGQYIVEGPGHCGECHTPRDELGGFKAGQWLSGAPNPEGKGKIPDITPGGSVASWSEGDIANYLETGFTPEYDTAGGTMVEVQKNMAKLPKEDREAIAAYLKVIPKL
ncbi:cytochrome c [Rhizobium sp. KVB221]|uniref:Cytochrome c n=1 Tax=Rhizobium setariae TaxID=2801340 RepID=A0A936YTY5_9HYPH|nr:cytochrome c [Rhizobium setariae]MBL0374434.1 cytochrome c [Rhizobium setariae]